MDFPKVWRQKCRMYFRENELLYTLNQLVGVLEGGKEWMEKLYCDSLDAYNEATGEMLPRLIFCL